MVEDLKCGLDNLLQDQWVFLVRGIQAPSIPGLSEHLRRWLKDTQETDIILRLPTLLELEVEGLPF